eukprot:3450998-Prymnesium_polylepis.1
MFASELTFQLLRVCGAKPLLCACPKANGHALAALSCEPRVLSQKEIMANSVDSVGKYIEVGRDDSYQS